MSFVNRMLLCVHVVIFSLVFMASTVAKASHVQGVVTFPDGSPVVGASVIFGGIEVKTNGRGAFGEEGVPEGDHVLTVEIADRIVYSKTLFVDENESDIYLAIELDGFDMIFVPNASFEEVYPDGSIPGWTASFSGRYTKRGHEIQSSEYMATDGRYSVRMEDDSDKAFVRLRSTPVEARAGTMYVALVDAYLEKGPAQIWLEFLDSSHKRIDYVTLRHRGTRLNTTIAPQKVAPEGTAFITISLYSTIANESITYYDNVRLWSRR